MKKGARGSPGRSGDDRVGVRISPWSTWQDMGMPDSIPTFQSIPCYRPALHHRRSSKPSLLRAKSVRREETHLIQFVQHWTSQHWPRRSGVPGWKDNYE
ncbi:hypothetical protein L210DRAFT_3582249 [Boletus edulis BED1]|uniref:Uncharacterized protein n=1 Tax=Boletus edulis BED1 TaxID=1328754 RepID=A0AAD4G6M3_BOLED|nr:hypothetical protein L210DRAFT_3582249 [Boletus edulis BED1]